MLLCLLCGNCTEPEKKELPPGKYFIFYSVNVLLKNASVKGVEGQCARWKSIIPAVKVVNSQHLFTACHLAGWGWGVKGCDGLICFFCALSQRLFLQGDSLRTATVCSSEVGKGTRLGLRYTWGQVKRHNTCLSG